MTSMHQKAHDMQDQIAARGAWGNGRSLPALMLLAGILLCSAGLGDPGVRAQEAPAWTPTSPSTDPAPPAQTPSTGTPEAPAASPRDSAAPPAAEATTEPPASEPLRRQTAEPVAPETVPVMEADAESDETAGESAALAPDTEEAAAGSDSGHLPHDLSPWGMYQAADIVVKAVMIGLVIACFVTWTVWLAKSIEISVAKGKIRRAIRRIAGADNLNQAVQAFEGVRGPGSALVREAAEEVARSARLLDHAGDQGVKERVTSRLSRVEAAAHRRMTLGTGVLATIGSTAPFVGLFGTVWGIMNSFIGIAQSQTTNLAVVAPGIAEALLATGLGLVAAIPAVIIYNVFARSIAGYKLLVADAAAGVERLVSHELDLRRAWQAANPGKPASAAAE